jgi:hypothetical protein
MLRSFVEKLLGAAGDFPGLKLDRRSLRISAKRQEAQPLGVEARPVPFGSCFHG